MKKRRQARNHEAARMQSITRLRVILWSLFAALFVILAALVWLKLRNPNTAPIQQVDITGSYQHTPHKLLEQAIMPYANTGFFAVPIDALKNRLLEFPWINRVEISRRWPGTLIVHISEQKAIAIWNNDHLMNDKADVFTPPRSTFPSQLLQLNGPVNQANLVLDAYLQMSQMLMPLHLKIVALELTPRLSWHFRLSNGTTVYLGRSDVIERLQRLIDVYPKVIENQKPQPHYIDMRYTNGMAVG